jgi:hypothetical protein
LFTKLNVTRAFPLLFRNPVVEMVVCAVADNDISAEAAKTRVRKRKIFFIR